MSNDLSRSELISLWLERGLSQKTAIALADKNIATAEELSSLNETAFLRTPNVGRKIWREIQEFLVIGHPVRPAFEGVKTALIKALHRADPGAHIEPREGGETVIDGSFDLTQVAEEIWLAIRRP
jgi:hypothetical protein